MGSMGPARRKFASDPTRARTSAHWQLKLCDSYTLKVESFEPIFI